ncbi:MAG TPA: hypothetical protein VK783_01845 [Bacteroidia bacterium]|nr:hypothetical protein [Bacteroidia bacterium]
MVQSDNFGYLYIYLWEWLGLPFYLFAIIFIASIYQRRKIKQDPIYSYYLTGLFIKLMGGIGFALIYYYYYQSGDTFSYYESALTMKNLMFHSFSGWARNEFGSASPENLALFTAKTGYPLKYMYYDSQTFTVIKFVTPIMILSFGGYLISSVIISWLSYAGLWRIFLVFSAYYPNLKKYFFISIICFPSALFWGSGILKDTITLSATGWAVYSIYNTFIVKKRRFRYTLILLLALYIIISIKPYIFMALLPGSLMWVFSHSINKIRNGLARALIVPVICIVCAFGGYYLLDTLKGYMGKFSIDKVAVTAAVTETDLKQDYYGGHSFDIGTFENTPSGYIKVFPKALVAGVFRPFIWESGNVVMLLSGIENTIILYLSLLVLKRTGPITLFKRVFKEPLLFFAFSFSIFFAFALGLTTSNFGALVRFKIAYLPFLVSALFILSRKNKGLALNTENVALVS